MIAAEHTGCETSDIYTITGFGERRYAFAEYCTIEQAVICHSECIVP